MMTGHLGMAQILTSQEAGPPTHREQEARVIYINPNWSIGWLKGGRNLELGVVSALPG